MQVKGEKMSVYSKLSLSAGGGIISALQQADQEANTATVLIGIGGTGVECIRTIKTQVYERLKPDDPEAVIPAYQHIRFLGLDTTEGAAGIQDSKSLTIEEQKNKNVLRVLDSTEFFNIGSAVVARALSATQVIEGKPELTWLKYKDIDPPNMTTEGAGGIRQIGRYMLMDKAQEFRARLRQEIDAAKLRLSDPKLNIHVFAGLSGGTGSGTFLDVCYIIRDLTAAMGATTIFGYFFLPDVNLSRIPSDLTDIREYIPKNGYAAMQELDYCMQIPQNGSSFTQVYKGGMKIKWDKAPVDMCHLICAKDEKGNVIPNAYQNAMNVTAEYIMDFLTHTPNQSFDLSQHIANYTALITNANGNRINGVNLGYCALGASCASIPLREINTYLASELFDKFSGICSQVPSKKDVEMLAIKALAKGRNTYDEIYGALRDEITEEMSNGYMQYQDDWRYVRDYGNGEMVRWYTNQTAEMLNHVEANAKKMITNNLNSLLGRIQAQLATIMVDINRGPIFAYGMLTAASEHNLLNIIDGIIRENNEKWTQESAQSKLRKEDYENAKTDFENRTKRRLRDSDARRFDDYEHYLRLLEEHKRALAIYDKMDQVLTVLKEQINEKINTYYLKINTVVQNLIDTFKENKATLASETNVQKDSFAVPLMTIKELKPSLDAEIDRVNIPNMLNAFMLMLMDPNNINSITQENENEITKIVTDFFVKNAFSNFAGRTITAFLEEKYKRKGIVGHAALTDAIYRDWMQMLTAKASPLFNIDPAIWSNATSKMASLSYPAVSHPIKAAAEKMQSVNSLWRCKPSALTDRIYVMCMSCAFPMTAYIEASAFENNYFSSIISGRHYYEGFYEGKENKELMFDNWSKLPSITPRSLIDLSNRNTRIQEVYKKTDQLYDDVVAWRILRDDNGIYQIEKSAEKEYRKFLEEELAKLNSYDYKNIIDIQRVIQEIQSKFDNLTMVKTEYVIPSAGLLGDKAVEITIQKDYFFAYPTYQLIAEKIFKHILELQKLEEEAVASMKKRIEELEVAEKKRQDEEMRKKIEEKRKEEERKAWIQDVKQFSEAIFSGVIKLNRLKVIYGDASDEIILSQHGLPYSNIPVYQGFLTYQELESEYKEEIMEKVQALFNEGAEELFDTCKKLKTELKFRNWKILGKRYERAEDVDKIDKFLTQMKKEFDDFCLEYDEEAQ